MYCGSLIYLEIDITTLNMFNLSYTCMYGNSFDIILCELIICNLTRIQKHIKQNIYIYVDKRPCVILVRSLVRLVILGSCPVSQFIVESGGSKVDSWPECLQTRHY